MVTRGSEEGPVNTEEAGRSQDGWVDLFREQVQRTERMEVGGTNLSCNRDKLHCR